MKSGQILILILLIVVVALAVGLSVASRNITNLRTSTQTEQSQRAFSAAEGGVEDVLSRLQTLALANPDVNNPAGQTFPIQVGDIEANVNVKANTDYEFTLKPGEVGQVNLDTYAGDIKIEWIKSSDGNENTSGVGDNTASIEATYVCSSNGGVCDMPGASGYSQHRDAYESTTISGQSGFSSVGCTESTEYMCNVSKTVSNAKILRIKPFWRQATVRVSGVGASASTFPVQTYEIESVATSEIGVTRRIKVTRTALEQLPAAFDYVLFSEGDIVK